MFGFIEAFCEENGICKEIFTNDKIAAEEIVLPSLEKYATGQVTPRYGICLYGITEQDIRNVIETGSSRGAVDTHYTIVRVERNMENELRKMIRELKNEPCQLA